MADAALPSPVAEAAAGAPSPATVEASPAPAPTADPAPAQAPAAEAAAAAEPAAVEVPATETVVAAEPIAEPAAEAAAAEGDKPAAEAAPAEPPAPPTYTDFKIPEGLTIPEERLTEFTALAGESGLSQDQAQKYLDLHASVVKSAQEAMATNQREVYDKMNRDWREDFNRHYGNRANTVADDARFAIRESTRDPKERAAVFSVLSADITGAGNNRHVIGAFAALGRRLRERTAPAVAAPARGQPASRADKRYGVTNGART